MNKTKKAIFESAIKVFSNYGYTGATMDEVVARAGVAKGSLYYHFKSKEELFIFIIKEGINLINEEIEEATKGIKDPYETIKVSAKVQLKYVYENKDLFKVIISQLWGTSERNDILREEMRTLIGKSSLKFKAVMDGGFIEKDDPILLSYGLIGVLISSALYEILNEGQYDHEEIVEKFMRYLENGINVKR
ncbi:MAG: TetR/AcrR family transcriptional regulator [Clostridium sp.]|uniref:TetR/AcrR family transcriptional regulator n=1 Tax=Clostridium sp. TaxID=1506 RepID=UPI001ED52B7D|nr:TetR/AcrR family transcriptional regulator [Clostridium sp.]MBS5884423.1 TetR/AcrR family transcriptional regulator [Clostridium sp.]MDU7147741.1 TetR/AcrR family transcriptional regulator [Clostridium sp.]MDU7241632.1 TetR/AcrR family transcriptional regulator [Clostridium sp.]